MTAAEQHIDQTLADLVEPHLAEKYALKLICAYLLKQQAAATADPELHLANLLENFKNAATDLCGNSGSPEYRVALVHTKLVEIFRFSQFVP